MGIASSKIFAAPLSHRKLSKEHWQAAARQSMAHSLTPAAAPCTERLLQIFVLIGTIHQVRA